MAQEDGRINKSEIEEILNRIKVHKNVDGYIITNTKGDVIKTTYKGEKKTEGEKILANIPELIEKAKIGVKNINPNVFFYFYYSNYFFTLTDYSLI